MAQAQGVKAGQAPTQHTQVQHTPTEHDMAQPGLAEEPGSQEAGAAQAGAAGGPVIELRDVTRVFDTTPPVHALHPTRIAVYEGQYVSVVGPSGSGKSTLLNLLGLLDRPSSGEYYLSGIPTGQASENQRAALRGGMIGFVFQSFHLLPHRSVLDNVLLATVYSGVPRPVRRARALETLNRVGLSHRINFMPSVLSGGERQRVAIARALVAQPRLLLADEPTGNLDSENTLSVLDLFDELHADGLTLMVITHDDEVSQRAERRVRIADGQLTELAV